MNSFKFSIVLTCLQ